MVGNVTERATRATLTPTTLPTSPVVSATLCSVEDARRVSGSVARVVCGEEGPASASSVGSGLSHRRGLSIAEIKVKR